MSSRWFSSLFFNLQGSYLEQDPICILLVREQKPNLPIEYREQDAIWPIEYRDQDPIRPIEYREQERNLPIEYREHELNWPKQYREKDQIWIEKREQNGKIYLGSGINIPDPWHWKPCEEAKIPAVGSLSSKLGDHACRNLATVWGVQLMAQVSVAGIIRGAGPYLILTNGIQRVGPYLTNTIQRAEPYLTNRKIQKAGPYLTNRIQRPGPYLTRTLSDQDPIWPIEYRAQKPNLPIEYREQKPNWLTEIESRTWSDGVSPQVPSWMISADWDGRMCSASPRNRVQFVSILKWYRYLLQASCRKITIYYNK